MKSNKRIVVIIFIGILVLFALIAFLRKSSLKRSFALTSGYIYEFGNPRYSGATIFFKFRFSVNGVTYHGNSGFPCAREKKLYFQSWAAGKVVQVVHEKNNPKNCKLLLTREDYKEYGLSIPEDYRSQVELIDNICNDN